MKFQILLILVCGCAAQKGSTKKQLKAISDELGELKSEQQQLKTSLKEQQDRMSDGFEELGQKIQSAENKCKKRGVWKLGMNINPADGHILGYTVGWATGNDIGSSDAALKEDYLNANVWVTPANYIAIVRHQQGVVDAVKVFKFKILGESLLTRFGLQNMNPGRQTVTYGGPIQDSRAATAQNLEDDPIFSVGGDLVFNWAYGNNGCRVALTGGHLSDAGVDDDNTHGLGNDFNVNPLTNTQNDNNWPHDISNIQNCPCRAMPDGTPACSNVKLQGTDHGVGSNLKSGPVYGNYAIYVSSEAETFPEPGNQLSLEIEA